MIIQVRKRLGVLELVPEALSQTSSCYGYAQEHQRKPWLAQMRGEEELDMVWLTEALKKWRGRHPEKSAGSSGHGRDQREGGSAALDLLPLTMAIAKLIRLLPLSSRHTNPSQCVR